MHRFQPVVQTFKKSPFTWPTSSSVHVLLDMVHMHCYVSNLSPAQLVASIALVPTNDLSVVNTIKCQTSNHFAANTCSIVPSRILHWHDSTVKIPHTLQSLSMYGNHVYRDCLKCMTLSLICGNKCY